MCLILCSVTLILFCSLIASADSNSLLNKEVMTYVDVSSQLVNVNNKILIENKYTGPIESYLFIVDPQWMRNLSYIEAVDKNGNTLNVNKVYTDNTWLKYEINFHNPLLPGQTETIQVLSVIVNYLQSYPKSVKQNEKHLVLFSFNVYYFSEYFTKAQTTFLYLGTTTVTSVDGAMYKISDDTDYGLKYGPYFDKVPISETPSIIHYENYSPFLTVEKLNRFIRISHWGYLSIWEHITLVHTGPKFKGNYERPVVNRNYPPDTRIESFVTTLPGIAFDIYFKDEIGLISSFKVDNTDPRKVEVSVRPRFVMYGGWKTQYEIGYSLPISDYVCYHNNSLFTLRVPVIDKIFPNMVIKEAEVSIILPEGAKFEDINPYFDLENNTDNRYCYFLDVICREVVSFKRSNLVERHGSDMSLTYSYPQFLLLSKPLTIITVLSLIFLFTMVLSRPSIISLQDNTIVQTHTMKQIPKHPAKEGGKHKKTVSKGKSKKC